MENNISRKRKNSLRKSDKINLIPNYVNDNCNSEKKSIIKYF
jgi:hypothetical protein